ncbi:TIGR03620 family F420-dependent LLM class oxidoreductase [Pseudonocardia sp. TRM90224]|uniref:TIGR03620 family F420-dependent LLM class oxidoreductase n=1 Tax=Pseudonocardia sp. TRM90224 TaxID=2812678 RepID=UPI001E426B1A|nr:TIGR03620 family F420-dependent LLM class oxidoreductase [Pseudonocardia sp. TRM90224]
MVDLGRVGVWTWAFDRLPWPAVADAVAEMEDLGFGTIWFGEAAGRDAPTQSALLLAATRRIAVSPGIANIYRHDPVELVQAERTLAEAFPGRFQLGLGVGAPRIAEQLGKKWGPPIETMRGFLDAMDATELTGPAPAQPAPRVLAALGPKMLELAAERTRGAHPFFVPVEHTAFARSVIGPDALLAAHVNVVLHDDPAEARAIARAAVAPWVAFADVVPSRWAQIRKLTGMTQDDLADGGSDRLVDSLMAFGDEAAIAERVRQQFAAGADHVCISVAGPDPAPPLGMDVLRRLAPALG